MFFVLILILKDGTLEGEDVGVIVGRGGSGTIFIFGEMVLTVDEDVGFVGNASLGVETVHFVLSLVADLLNRITSFKFFPGVPTKSNHHIIAHRRRKYELFHLHPLRHWFG